MSSFDTVAAAVIFVATYLIVAIGKIPIYRIDRAGAALLGGSLMVGLGILSADEAYQAISFDTLTLLLGMMIVAANLRVSGFFRLVTYWVTRHVRRPLALLVAVVLVCGAFSAVLVLKPFVANLADPQRAWLTVAMASTLAGNFTLVGSVANLIVAYRAANRGIRIGLWEYFKVGAPVATLLIGLAWL